MLVYIAGPIRGMHNYNQLAFHQAQLYLERLGHEVINPIQMDKDYDGEINAHASQLVYARRDTGIILGSRINNPTDAVYLLSDYDGEINCARRDTGVILDFLINNPIDAIYMLSGWSKSVGSRAELALAQWIGAKIILEDPNERVALLEVECE